MTARKKWKFTSPSSAFLFTLSSLSLSLSLSLSIALYFSSDREGNEARKMKVSSVW
jgi:hypothetical protein